MVSDVQQHLREMAVIDVRVQGESLSKAVAEATAEAGLELGVTMRKTTADVLHNFQVASPVDTGRFRAGWSPYLIHTGLAPMVEGPDGAAVAEGRAAGSFLDTTGEVTLSPQITVSNAVTYGPDLELGRSPQADAGYHEAILVRHAANVAGELS